MRGIGVESAKVQNPFEQIKSPSQFIKQIYSHESVLGCSIKEMELYVELLKLCVSNSKGSSSGGISISGLVMYADPKKGEIQSFNFQNLVQLHLVILQSMNISKQKQVKITKKIEKSQNQSKGRSM